MTTRLLHKWQFAQAALLDADLSKGAAAALIRLLWYHNASDASREHHCFPSYERIASDLRFAKRHLIRLVNELDVKGWIKIERRHNDKNGQQTSNSFRFLFERVRSIRDDETGTALPAMREGDIEVTPPTREGDTHVTPGVTPMSLPGVTPMSPETGKRETGKLTSPAGGASEDDESGTEPSGFLFGDLIPVTPVRPARAPKQALDTERQWQEFRSIYVRPGSNFKTARALFERAVKAGHPPGRIVEGARAYMAFVRAEGRDNSKIKAAETFLAAGKDHWLVDYSPVPQIVSLSTAPDLTTEQWAAFVNGYRNGDSWPPALGPTPDAAGCRAPPHILRSHEKASLV